MNASNIIFGLSFLIICAFLPFTSPDNPEFTGVLLRTACAIYVLKKDVELCIVSCYRNDRIKNYTPWCGSTWQPCQQTGYTLLCSCYVHTYYYVPYSYKSPYFIQLYKAAWQAPSPAAVDTELQRVQKHTINSLRIFSTCF